MLQEYNFQNTFKTEKNILSLVGFFPFRDPGKYSWKIIRRVSVFTMLVIFVGQMFLQAFYIDFNSLIEACMVWVTEFGFMCKLAVFIYNSDEILRLEDELKQPTYTKFPKVYLKAMKNDIKFTRRLTNIYRLVIVSYASYLSLVRPFINKRDQRSLIFEAHMPCDLENNACYFSVIAFQTINAYISSQTNINMECLFCKLVTACSCLFDVLKHNLSDIDYRYEEIAEGELRNNVIMHQNLLR